MIREFFDSWALFQHAYLAGWFAGILLSLIGVVVVAREQIFLSAAVSQASTLGIAVGMWVGGAVVLGTQTWLETDAFLSAMAVAFGVLAALVTAHGRDAKHYSAEAVTGWVFLLSASGSILLLAHSPHGMDEIQRLLSSSLIGAQEADVWVFGMLAAVTASVLALFHRRILLVTVDPSLAMALGIRVKLWSVLISAWLGLAAGLTMRTTGMLYIFGCLVLPALAAKQVCRELRSMFLVSVLGVLVTGVLGFCLANYYDYPPAQLTVGLLCAVVALTWVFRQGLDLASRYAVRNTRRHSANPSPGQGKREAGPAS